MKTKNITIIGMMAALVFVGTYFFKVPTPTGYTHLGDCMIILAVYLFGWKKGSIAGSIGAALSDLLGGYMHWVLPTLFIKAGFAIVMGVTLQKLFPNFRFKWLLASILGGMVQIIGYTSMKIFYGYGLSVAIASIPSITIQTSAGILIAGFFIATFDKLHVTQKIKSITQGV